jgi:cyclopropane fatty-acyl-phospholipid synthase-like methyltransferase
MSMSKEDVLQFKAILARHDPETGYSILPERFNALVAGTADENRPVFHERERFDFFRRHVDFAGKSCLDIGCNTGYFLFSMLDAGARRVTGYEGRKSCGEFVEAVIAKTGCQDRFAFFNEFYEFAAGSDRYDVALLLNVLHHLGGDYGAGQPDMAHAKHQFLEQLNGLSARVGTLIFQLGFNWKGDRRHGLFEHGTKAEMIAFIRAGTFDHWHIEQIGVAEKAADGHVAYQPLDDHNGGRNDALGEFLNRPLFILRSKQFTAA